jgi:hypothetical protein
MPREAADARKATTAGGRVNGSEPGSRTAHATSGSEALDRLLARVLLRIVLVEREG